MHDCYHTNIILRKSKYSSDYSLSYSYFLSLTVKSCAHMDAAALFQKNVTEIQ